MAAAVCSDELDGSDEGCTTASAIVLSAPLCADRALDALLSLRHTRQLRACTERSRYLCSGTMGSLSSLPSGSCSRERRARWSSESTVRCFS